MSRKKNDSHNNENICERKNGKAVPNFWTILSYWFDEDGHPYYENDQIRQELIENLGYTFIRINPDFDLDAGFDLDVEIAKNTITLTNRL